MILQGALAAIKAFTEAVNGNVVSHDEVLRRERICKSCPMRKKVTGAPSKISRYLGMLASKHRVPSEVHSYACNVCGCSLVLLLPATPADLHKDSPEEAEKRPKACWIPKALDESNNPA
jgi:hypothetical protein